MFRNPVGALLEEALMSGQFRWLCTHAMRDELARVAARESLARWAIDAEALMSAFDARAMGHDMPPMLGAADRLQCSDPDDQKFINLANAQRVHALLTRDRALLRLASRARNFGVLIAAPEGWPATTRLPRDPASTRSITDMA